MARFRRSMVVVALAAAALTAAATAQAGGISGSVTDASTTAPVSGVFVDVYDTAGDFVMSSSSAGTGAYSITGLADGSYFVATFNSLGYRNEVYDNILCPGFCNVTIGTPVVVSGGATVTGINFALSLGGRVSGLVTDVSTGTPLASVQVRVRDAGGATVAYGFTNAAGIYTTDEGVATGSYFAQTDNSAGYINELYDDVPCLSTCNVAGGTSFAVTAGSTTPGINFALSSGGRISGTVRDAVTLAPLTDVSISVLNAGGSTVTFAFTDAAGNYVTDGGLPTGSYFVRTRSDTGYVNEIYDDIPCVGSCRVETATPVSVTVGGTTTGIDFDLASGSRISGLVTDAVTGLPLGDVQVSVLDGSGVSIVSGRTDAAGLYTTEGGLPSGAYYVRTFNSGGYVNQLYPAVACVGFCSVTSGTTVSVVAPAPTAGINFALTEGARISGTIRDGATLAALSNVQVFVYNGAGSFLISATSNPTGSYLTNEGLPTGTYFVRTSNGSGYLDELYNNLACAVGTCSVTGGNVVSVTAGSTTSGVNFDLSVGGRVSGTVTDAGTAAPLSGVRVSVLNTSGTFLTDGTTDTFGNYITRSGLPTGSYFLRTDNSQGFINERYDGIACVGSTCPVTGGTPVAVTVGATTPGIAFALDRGGRVSGTLIDDVTSAPLSGLTVTVSNAGSSGSTSGTTDALGQYLTGPGLPAGTYFARTSNSRGYVNELYDDVACPFGCSDVGGTPIVVSPPATTGGVDFALGVGGSVTGTVRDAVTATPISGASVSIFDDSGASLGSGTTDALGRYLVQGLPAGTYRARTNNSLGYINELYPDVPCAPSCNLTSGTPLTVVMGAAVPGIDFDLTRGGRVAGRVTNASTGVPLSGVGVSIVTSAGTTVTSGLTDLAGNYVSAVGLATGTYFVRTSNSQGFLNELYNDVPCLGGCNVFLGTPVAVVLGSTTPGIDIALTAGGRVTGVVTDVATAAPLSGIGVSIADASGRFVTSGTTDGFGVYLSRDGLPAGNYFATTNNTIGYVNELYDDLPCVGGCTPTVGTTFSVTAGLTTSGISFGLASGARVSGEVTDETSGLPLAGVTVNLHDSSGRFVTSGRSDFSGHFVTGSGVPAGTYYAVTRNSLGYVNELFGGTACLGTCLVTAGTPIVLPASGTTPGIDFSLAAGGRIAGTVLNAATLAPAPGVSVLVFDGTGRFLTSGLSDSLGGYVTADGLVTGSYFARTSNNQGLINRLYNAIDCLSCDVTTGTAIAVTTGSTTGSVNFTMSAGARISGTVTHAVSGAPLSNVRVDLLDGAGTLLAAAVTDGLGNYIIGSGVPTGSYRARTQNNLGYVNEFWNNHSCVVSCSVADGDPIALTAPGTTTGISFDLVTDTDLADGDGIFATIDKDAVTAADESTTPTNDFNDIPIGGATTGTVTSRGGWTVTVGDVSPGGVQATVAGSGATPATFETCAVGSAEELALNAAGESAIVTCSTTTGSTHAQALLASPTVELRDPPGGAGVVVLLTTGQGATIGSPVTADPSNTETIQVLLVDSSETPIGSFALEPGESVDAAVSPSGTVDVAVIEGTVTVTVGGESVTLNPGETHQFTFGANPDQILAGLQAQVDALRASGDIRNRGVAHAIKDVLGVARRLIARGHERSAVCVLRTLVRALHVLKLVRLITPRAYNTLVPPIRQVIDILS